MRAGIGQRHDSEVALRDDKQFGELPAVPDATHSTHIAQEPADADGVARSACSQGGRGLLHLMQHVGGKHPCPAFCTAIPKMETRPAQQVGHRGCKTPTRVVAARLPPGPRKRQGPVLVAIVSNREAPGHDVIASKETVRERQWLADEQGHRPLKRLACNVLDDPPQQVVAGLAVGDPGARRLERYHLNQLLHRALQGVVLLAGIGVDPPVKPGGVVEQPQRRDRSLLVLQL